MGRDGMSYVKHILQPDEKVVVIGRLHWIIYAHAILWFLCASGAAAAAFHVRDTNYLWLTSVAFTCLFLLFGLALAIRA